MIFSRPAVIFAALGLASLSACETFKENPGAFCGGLCAIGALIGEVVRQKTASREANLEADRNRQKRITGLLEPAQEGDVEAQYELGNLYYLDDKTQSWVWFCRAAMQGHSGAQVSVGLTHTSGIEPVAEDHAKAYMWYSLAGNQGAHFKSGIAAKMSPEQIAQAKRMVMKWKPDPTACKIGTAKT